MPHPYCADLGSWYTFAHVKYMNRMQNKQNKDLESI